MGTPRSPRVPPAQESAHGRLLTAVGLVLLVLAVGLTLFALHSSSRTTTTVQAGPSATTSAPAPQATTSTGAAVAATPSSVTTPLPAAAPVPAAPSPSVMTATRTTVSRWGGAPAASVVSVLAALGTLLLLGGAVASRGRPAEGGDLNPRELDSFGSALRQIVHEAAVKAGGHADMTAVVSEQAVHNWMQDADTRRVKAARRVARKVSAVRATEALDIDSAVELAYRQVGYAPDDAGRADG